MSTSPNVQRLLEEVEEEYSFDNVLPLYTFAWSLAGMIPRSEAGFASACLEAYEAFRASHPDLVLVWVPWPIDLAAAQPADTDTPIDLDLDPNQSPGVPLLALVQPDELIHATG